MVLIFVLAAGWLLLLPKPYHSVGLHSLASSLFFPNLIFWKEVGYFDAIAETKPLLHLWSLGVEEQFYLIWPLLLMMLGRRPRALLPALIIVVLTSFAYSCFASLHDRAAGFYSPLSRLWELGLGGILAALPISFRSNRAASLLGVLLITGSAILLNRTSVFPGALALLPTGGAAILIAFGSGFLTWRWIVSLGLISYPLYLWHWPLLSFAATSGFTSLWIKLALIVVSIALSWFTYRLVEYPIRFGKWHTSGVWGAIAATVAVASFSSIVVVSDGMPWRYQRENRPVLAMMNYPPGVDARVRECWLRAKDPFDDFRSECSRGSVLIWGDSHAGRLYSGFSASGAPVAQFTRDSCMPILREHRDTCRQSNERIIDTIIQLRPKTVILFAAWLSYGIRWPAPDDFVNSLRSSISRIRPSVEEIIVLGPAPVWEPNLPMKVFAEWNVQGHLPDRLTPSAKVYRNVDKILAAAAVNEKAKFISVFEALCDESGCLTHTPPSRSNLLSWDNGHLTTDGARFVLDALRLR